MEKSHLIGAFIVLVGMALSTFAITQAIKDNKPATVVKEVVVTPSASPSAALSVSPTVTTPRTRTGNPVVTTAPTISGAVNR